MYLVSYSSPSLTMTGGASPTANFERCATSWSTVRRTHGLHPFDRRRTVARRSERYGIRDEIVVYEVMCETVDRAWWSNYRATLERRFRQDELVIRVQQVERL